MRSHRLDGLALFALLGLACATPTPYQPMGDEGGYKESKLAPGVYWIEVRGNAYTRQEGVAKIATSSGRELCKRDGFPGVRMEGVVESPRGPEIQILARATCIESEQSFALYNVYPP